MRDENDLSEILKMSLTMFQLTSQGIPYHDALVWVIEEKCRESPEAAKHWSKALIIAQRDAQRKEATFVTHQFAQVIGDLADTMKSHAQLEQCTGRCKSHLKPCVLGTTHHKLRSTCLCETCIKA